MIDEALGSGRRAHPLVDESQHFYRALPAAGKGSDPVTDPDRRGGLGGDSVDSDMPTTTRLGSLRPGLVEADRPEPSVHPGDIHAVSLHDELADC